MSNWTAADIPDQASRTALVTGANSGLGYRTAAALAAAGAEVLIACRNPERGAEALQRLRDEHPVATIELLELDLADLGSVRKLAASVSSRSSGLDLLINNAGVMAPPRRQTADGFELQLGTNHLGHFALTAGLIESLLAADSARIVTVSSVAHRMGSIDFDDLHWEHRYERWRAYGRSKLANLLFAFELDRRLRAAGADAISVAAHPGYSATNLQSSGPTLPGSAIPGVSSLYGAGFKVANKLLAQPDSMGALPSLYGATAPGVVGGEFFGPDGLGGARGNPERASASSKARDLATAARLWEVSEQLTGVSFEIPTA